MKLPWRRARQPTPGFLPGETHEQRRLAGYSPPGGAGWGASQRLSMHIHSMKLEAKDLPPKDKSPPKIPNLSMQLQIITDDTGLESGDPGREIQLSQSSEVPLSKSSRL